jgi:hypothetical protein
LIREALSNHLGSHRGDICPNLSGFKISLLLRGEKPKGLKQTPSCPADLILQAAKPSEQFFPLCKPVFHKPTEVSHIPPAWP